MVVAGLIFHLLHKLAPEVAVEAQVLLVQQQEQALAVLAALVQLLRSQAFLQLMLAVAVAAVEQTRPQDKQVDREVLAVAEEERVQMAHPLQELFTQAVAAVLGQTELQAAKMAAPV